MRLSVLAVMTVLFASPLLADCPMTSAACGQTVNQTLTPSCQTEGCYVQFNRFTVTTRTSLTLTVQTAAFSPAVVLYADSRMIGSGSAGQGSAARVTTVVDAGTYTVAVRAVEKGRGGAYSLAIGCASAGQ